MSTARRPSLKEDAGLLIGATGTVVAADQTIKSMASEENQLEHIVKAGVGAAVAIGAYEMLCRGELDPDSWAGGRRKEDERGRPHSSSSGSRSRSHSPNPAYHKSHLFEEIIGAYNLGKELIGDKKHHFAHLVGEAIGATGLIQELRARDEEL